MFNKIIRLLVANDLVFWFSHYLFISILSIYIVRDIDSGSTVYAGILLGIYFFSRGANDLIFHHVFKNITVNTLIAFMVLGIALVSSSYFMLSVATTLVQLSVVCALMGVGAGIYNPARFEILFVLRSKPYEEREWEILDGVWVLGVGLAVVIGALIELNYGFTHLFKVAGYTSLLSVVPLFFLLKNLKES